MSNYPSHHEGDELALEALNYQKGIGVAQDLDKAVELYLEAHASGNSNATVQLGWLYENGIGVESDHQKAIDYYRQAASIGRGHPLGHYNLGRLLYEEGKYDEALLSFKRAAELGFARALVFLGIAYERGHGVEQDQAKAVEFYKKAASDGEVDGLIRLARCFRYGLGVEENIPEAVKLYQQASVSDNPWAWYELAWLYHEGEIPTDDRHKRFLECLEKAADLGVPVAQAYFGEALGMGVYRERDLERGIKYLIPAAEAGEPRAKYIMAVLLAKGEGLEKDSAAAFRLCEEAAFAGEAGAQYMLAAMFERGDGVERDISTAIEWYERAASSGSPKAKESLKELARER